MLEQRGLQHDPLLQGCALGWEAGDGTKNSPGLGGIVPAEAARYCRADFRSRRCVSKGGANRNGDGRPAGRTGLNFYVTLLLASNKLKPEKT